jgi:alpha-1,2-mannosyltransferase
MADHAPMVLGADRRRAPLTARGLGGAGVFEIDWGRLGRRLALLTVPVLAVVQLAVNVLGRGNYAGDFTGGIRPAGWAILHGRSPYPPPHPHQLLVLLHGFVTPPPIGLVAAPLSLLPSPPAIALWNLACVAALALALRVMGVRNKWIYLLALCSFPAVDSLENGQPDALFALAAALAWRYRGSWRGGVSAAFLIAAKLLAWPLLIWMAVTRRYQALKVTAGATVLIVAGSWAVIGFRGLAQYPHLMAADAKAFEAFRFSSSLVHILSPLGLSIGATRALALLVATALAAAIIALARGSDEGWFTGALTFGVLCSPVVWLHYEVVLFVPLALARRRPVLMWAVIAYSYWFILLFLHTAESRAIGLTAVMVCSVVWATMEPRSAAKARALDASACPS